MTNAPSFDEAAVRIIVPEYLSDEVVDRLGEAVKGALPEGTTFVGVRGFNPDETDVSSMTVPWWVVPVAKEGIEIVGGEFKHQIAQDRAAERIYNQRADTYNAQADRWWAQQMGRG